ncbi:MAG: hypothetical protein NVS9B10_15430 [Nevskia sp.]
MTAWQRGTVWACGLLGGLFRLVYVLVLHPATLSIYSDMQGYHDRALRFAAGLPENIGDTLYPPGASMLLGLLYALDPSFVLALVVQWLLSLAIMALVWLIARRVYGTSAAVVALVIATLHLPFTHYAALFLSENGFTVFVLASVWLLLVAVQAQRRRVMIAAALLAGAAVGLAIAFKNTMLGPFALTGLLCAIHALRHRDRRLVATSVALLVGLAAIMVPLAERCTRLNEGRYCLSANNLGMNVLMGHYGEMRDFRWIDGERGITFYFTAVESTLRGYGGTVTLDYGAYDSPRNLALARDWVAAHPRAALGLSLHNVWSLFAAPTFWPQAQFRGIDFGVWSQRGFWLFILLPALAQLRRRAGAMWRFSADSLPDWLLLAPILGLMVSVFVSIAEVRFRVPFDGLLIVLAAPAWVRVRASVRAGRRSVSPR